MKEIPPNPPSGIKVPQEDYIQVLEQLRVEVRGITVDGPSGDKFIKVVDRLIGVLLEVL